jgi:formylglycine-generating enzyme
MKRLIAWSVLAAAALGGAAASLMFARAPEAPPGRDRPSPVPVALAPAESARAGAERADNGLKMAFCWCPPGTFRMGSPPASRWRSEDEGPATVTERRGFWMGKFEVTQAQWQQVMGSTLREQRAKDPTQPRPVGDGTMRDHVGEGPDHPIYYVSHAEAGEFCRRLTEEERRAGRLPPGWEFLLPTEAQWEYACRAGTTTATAFGDRLGSADANFDGTNPFNGAPVGPYPRGTTPVGRYRANAWGLHDMHGNVCEWCRDGYSGRLAGGVDPLGPPSAPYRVFRGGCWHSLGVQCLSAHRSRGAPGDRGSGLGFRVVRAPIGP